MNYKDDKESGYETAVESISVLLWDCHNSAVIVRSLACSAVLVVVGCNRYTLVG